MLGVRFCTPSQCPPTTNSIRFPTAPRGRKFRNTSLPAHAFRIVVHCRKHSLLRERLAARTSQSPDAAQCINFISTSFSWANISLPLRVAKRREGLE